jgi:hypothetical protein
MLTTSEKKKPELDKTRVSLFMLQKELRITPGK